MCPHRRRQRTAALVAIRTPPDPPDDRRVHPHQFPDQLNAFLWPQIMLQDQAKYTLPVALPSLSACRNTNPTRACLMAATLLGVLPVVVLFFVLQKDFVSGLATGAFKG